MLILDLHRKRHEDVEREVIRFVEKHWNSGKEAEIITGNSHKMKALVITVLDEYALEHTVGRQFDHNTGYIVTTFE